MLPVQGSEKQKGPKQGGQRRPSAGVERGHRPRDQVPALFQESGGAGGSRLGPHVSPPNRWRAAGPSPAVRVAAAGTARPSSSPGHSRPHQHLNKGKAPLRLPSAPTGAMAPNAAARRLKTSAGAKRTLATQQGQPRTSSPGHKKPRTEVHSRPIGDPMRKNPDAGRPRQQQGAPLRPPLGHAKSHSAKTLLKKKPPPKPVNIASPSRRAPTASFRRSPLSGSPLVRAKTAKIVKSSKNNDAKGKEHDPGGLVLLLDEDRVERGDLGFTAKGLKAALQACGCPATIKEFKLPPGAGNFLFILLPRHPSHHGTPDPLNGVVVPFAGAVLPASRLQAQSSVSSGLVPRSSDPRPTYEYFTDISANPRGLVLLEGDCGGGGCVPGPVEDASELDGDIDGDGWSVIRCGADDTARLITEAARSLSGSQEQLSELLWYSQYHDDVSDVLPCPLITLRQLKAELQEDEGPGDELQGGRGGGDNKGEEAEKEKGKGKMPMGGSTVNGSRKPSKLVGAKIVGRKSKPGGILEAAKSPLQRTPSKRPLEPQEDTVEGSNLGYGRQPTTMPPLRQEQSGAGRPATAPAGAKQGCADGSNNVGGGVQPAEPCAVSVVTPHTQQRGHKMESARKKTIPGGGLAASLAGQRGAEGSRPSEAAPRRQPESSKAPVRPPETSKAPVRPPETSKAPVRPPESSKAPVRPPETSKAPVRPPETRRAPVEREQGPSSSNQPAVDNRRMQVNGSIIELLPDDDDSDEEPPPQRSSRGAGKATSGGAAGVKEEEPQPRQQHEKLVRLVSGDLIEILSSSSDEEEEEGQAVEDVDNPFHSSSDEEGEAAGGAEGPHMTDLD